MGVETSYSSHVLLYLLRHRYKKLQFHTENMIIFLKDKTIFLVEILKTFLTFLCPVQIRFCISTYFFTAEHSSKVCYYLYSCRANPMMFVSI